ncbi:hypothetical protein LEP1GSC172_2433 [Leptospira noguchii]|uniref:Uncharacterized protein n=1 Tax=Leptospira noguchii TaxID=28182 RepID=M6VLG3_9LEPT|nr:hypothetical protein LEP1GSC172_2433 [Leptospira noguchii]
MDLESRILPSLFLEFPHLTNLGLFLIGVGYSFSRRMESKRLFD